MSAKLDKRNTTIDSNAILKSNVSPSKVYQPQWINNQTRLNQTNVEAMRTNLIKYIDLVAGSLFSKIETDINTLIDKSAGWIDIDVANNKLLGEIFNDYENNKVASDKQYQAAFGHFTEVNGDGQFVCGVANQKVENALAIVGCGTVTYQKSEDTTPQQGTTYYTLVNDNYIKFTGTNFKQGTDYYVVNVDRKNALVVTEDGKLHVITELVQEGPSDFKGTVTFETGFISKGDSSVDGKLTVTGVPKNKTHVVRKKELDDLRSELSGALHYIGIVTEAPTTNQTSVDIITIDDDGKHTITYSIEPNGQQKQLNSGDVVLVGNYEDTENGTIITNTGAEYIVNITKDDDGNVTKCVWADYSTYANYVLTEVYRQEKETLHKALFSDGEVPQWDDSNNPDSAKSLQTQLEKKISDESQTRQDIDKKLYGGEIPSSGNLNMTTMDTNRKNSDKYITGLLTDVPTTGKYGNSNEQLRIDLGTETSNREKGDSNIAGRDTIPENYENSNEKLRLKIDDINTALGFLADKNVIASEPSMTLTSSNIKAQEIGTVITPAFTTTFDSGSYKYGPNPTGVEIEECTIGFNGSLYTTKDLTDLNAYKFDSITVSSTSTTLTATIKYSDGDIPKNNLGLDYEEGKIIGDTLSKTLTLSGYRQGCFYGTVNTSGFTVDNITSSVIRGLTKTNAAYAKGNKTLTVPVGATAILIACPKTNTGPTKVLNTTVNAEMTTLSGAGNIVKTLTVAGAGSDPGIEYNVWMFKPNSAYTTTASLTITLG